MDTRLQQLEHWLATQGYHHYTLEPASADASFRRYFRIQYDGESFIVMDAPPEKEDTAPFIRVADLMSAAGLHVPRIMAQDTEQGFLQLSDLGSQLYLPALNESNVEALYGDALEALLQLQQQTIPGWLPEYDRELLLQEMQLFADWYLQRHLGLELNSQQQTVLQKSFEHLAGVALEQPEVIVHRDYHSRNLLLSEPNPGVIDFQDAVRGPVTYDLVSLLRDCYIAWPRPRIEQWVRDYLQRAQQAGIVESQISADQFLRWFDLMGIQRHLKASGIFARLNYRDAKPGYLADIPRTLGYVLQVIPDYDELAGFAELLQSLELPRRLEQITPRSVSA
ncbi:MAG: phosphotransferase [Pseudomonadota bacterium]|nr:phosphotransferase [Pseudomonadota bacterium]